MHDADCLEKARTLLKQARSHSAMADLVTAAVARNAQWRGQQCINLVAAESPTSPGVRSLLSSEVGTRASGGHIGRAQRFFSGMKHIDELESLCVELLKMTFAARHADHRLMGGMSAVLTTYTALTRPSDTVMTGPLIRGGDTSNRHNGPQGGIMAWNDNELTEPIHKAIFPTLTGSHQINRVAALAVAATELLEYGGAYMTQVVRNAQALARSLDNLGVTAFYREKGYTQTHQIVIDSKPFACGRDAVQRLEAANIIANEMPLPWDIDPTRESGIRLGTVEVTRLGMKETHMEWIARQITEVLLHRKDPTAVADAVIDFMKNHRTVYYCHEHGLPR